MSEALLSNPTDQVPAKTPVDPKYELARVVEARTLQGYKVESLTETRAVFVVKGPKRLLGMRGGVEQRTEVTIDDEGKAVTRAL